MKPRSRTNRDNARSFAGLAGAFAGAATGIFTFGQGFAREWALVAQIVSAVAVSLLAASIAYMVVSALVAEDISRRR